MLSRVSIQHRVAPFPLRSRRRFGVLGWFFCGAFIARLSAGEWGWLTVARVDPCAVVSCLLVVSVFAGIWWCLTQTSMRRGI